MAASGRESHRGEIITFYSYKGGTGRTMALANVACLLGERIPPREKVLVVDWDLEAPGLHRFFPGRLDRHRGASVMDLGLDATPGVIDLFTWLSDALPASEAESEEACDQRLAEAFSGLAIDAYVGPTDVAGVHIMRAGRNDDGQYAKRVNTFGWEALFRRAPGVYRAFAERLAQAYRYVLVDSRTGVTDISGICTSLLPEKLVVVFTPNRQSLTGVKELVEQATAYRRRSDDLRPLLVFPLPSRIEGSLEQLRALWRMGDQDRQVVGYQPMFEQLLAKAYGLERCSLAEYFDGVQIQQTPDYAYGEEIAVRRSSDRLSIQESFRIFTERLTSGAPPWEVPGGAVDDVPTPARGTSAPPLPAAGSPGPSWLSDRETGARRRVFLSYARADLERVALEAGGFDVWWDRTAQHGAKWVDEVTKKLDEADAIVVCWSEASVQSDWVRAEADEGLRRGLLLPVLLDDVVPPIGFRRLRSADLRRDPERGLAELLEAVEQTTRSLPGGMAAATVPVLSAPSPARSHLRLWLAGAGAAVLAIAVFVLVAEVRSPNANTPVVVPMQDPPTPSDEPAGTTGSKPGTTTTPGAGDATSGRPVAARLPSFVGLPTSDAKRTADVLGLDVLMTDGASKDVPFLEGVVTSQTPVAGSLVAGRTPVRLVISTLPATTPTVVGMTLTDALKALERARLRLGATETRRVADAAVGTVIQQRPAPGTSVAARSPVDVVVVRGAQLSDYEIRIYYLDGNAEAKALAYRVRDRVTVAGTDARLLARPRSFFTGRLAPKKGHEIRYGSASERPVATELQRALASRDLPRFTPLHIQQETGSGYVREPRSVVSVLIATGLAPASS
jgi:hypothetical protein